MTRDPRNWNSDGAIDENGGTGKCVHVCVLREEGTRRAEGGGVLAMRRK